MNNKMLPTHLRVVTTDPASRAEQALRARAMPQAQDQELIARAASTALAQWKPSEQVAAPKRWVTFAVAAGLLLAASTASYATLKAVWPKPRVVPSLATHKAPAKAKSLAPEQLLNELPDEPPLAPAPAEPVVAPQISPKRTDPNILLERASEARQKGQIAKAQKLYQQLQAKHPRSAQALTSRISMGRLLLSQPHQAAAALNQFNAYLAAGLHGPLHEQALAGKAQALEALGKAGAAAATWDNLLRLYPQSLYGAHARQRTTP